MKKYGVNSKTSNENSNTNALPTKTIIVLYLSTSKLELVCQYYKFIPLYEFVNLDLWVLILGQA